MFKMRAKMITVGLLGTAALLPIDFAKAEQVGHASWYALPANMTANGERMNPNELTAAHRSLPFGTRVLVENLNNGRTVVVRINDRGPFIGGRIIDLSKAAAASIGMIGSGTAKVRVSSSGGSALAALGEAQLKAKKGVALAAAESAATEAPAAVEPPAPETSAKMEATLTPVKAKSAATRKHGKTKSAASHTKSTRVAMKASSKTKHVAKSHGSQSKVKVAAAAKASLASKSLTKSAAKSAKSHAHVAASSKGSRAAARHGSRGRTVVASAAHPYTILGKAPGFMKSAHMRSAG
jgi:peptidoglycan lytic transglycosylase